MIKYFLIYTETYTTTLSEEAFYKSFAEMKYDYFRFKNKSGKIYLDFRNSFIEKEYDAGYLRTVTRPMYLKTEITYIPKIGKSVVTIRYKPDYKFIVMAFLFSAILFYAMMVTYNNPPHTEVLKGVWMNKPHTTILKIRDSWLCGAVFLLILIFFVMELYKYFKAKRWLIKQLFLSRETP